MGLKALAASAVQRRSRACRWAWLALAFSGLLSGQAAAGKREEQLMAQRASAELKASLALAPPPASQIKALIQQERFAEFEALSRQYEEKFKTDPRYESPLIALYSALNETDDRLREQLDKWVARRPSYISYGARGIYKKNHGYAVRGSAATRDTPPAQMQRMKQLHDEAIADLLAAIKDNARFAPAYVALISINRGAGDTASAERAVNEAVRWIPETYYVRHAYLRALHPRWGGDFSLMQAYANSLDQAVRLNPRIWSLKAEVPAELGYEAWLSGDHAQAVRYYTEALAFGDRLEFLRNRGQAHMSARQYPAARRDFSRYLEYIEDPEIDRLLKRLAGMP